MDILNNSPLLSTFFKIVGMYAFIWWLTEHFTSLFEFTWNSIFDLLKNESKKSLQEKYGQWAGTKICYKIFEDLNFLLWNSQNFIYNQFELLITI